MLLALFALEYELYIDEPWLFFHIQFCRNFWVFQNWMLILTVDNNWMILRNKVHLNESPQMHYFRHTGCSTLLNNTDSLGIFFKFDRCQQGIKMNFPKQFTCSTSSVHAVTCLHIYIDKNDRRLLFLIHTNSSFFLITSGILFFFFAEWRVFV